MGDQPGHEFRGNQWSGGGSAQASRSDPKSSRGDYAKNDPPIKSVKVEYVGGSTTYKLSDNVAAMGGDHRYVWDADLLPSLDGQRPAGIAEPSPGRDRAGAADRINAIAKEYGVTKGFAVDVRYEGRFVGMATISRERVNDKDYPSFLQAAGSYLAGRGASTAEEKVLGKWLGFPKEATEKYLKNKEKWFEGR